MVFCDREYETGTYARHQCELFSETRLKEIMTKNASKNKKRYLQGIKILKDCQSLPELERWIMMKEKHAQKWEIQQQIP